MDILIGLYWISFIGYLVLTLLSNAKEDKWFWLVFCWAAPVMFFLLLNDMREKEKVRRQSVENSKKMHGLD